MSARCGTRLRIRSPERLEYRIQTRGCGMRLAGCTRPTPQHRLEFNDRGRVREMLCRAPLAGIRCAVIDHIPSVSQFESQYDFRQTENDSEYSEHSE